MELRGSHTFPVSFGDEVVRDAVRVFVIERTMREQKWKWAAAGLVVVAGIVLLFQGNFPLALLAFLVACFPAVFSAVVWRAHSSSAFGRYNRMTGRSAQITVDPEGFGITSNLGEGRLNWHNVTEIWERPLSFMLFSGTSAFNILPRQTMPQEVQAFLSAKAI